MVVLNSGINLVALSRHFSILFWMLWLFFVSSLSTAGYSLRLLLPDLPIGFWSDFLLSNVVLDLAVVFTFGYLWLHFKRPRPKEKEERCGG